MKRKLSVLLCLFFSFAAVSQAQAYLDPGIGTYTFQILIAGLMAAIFSLSRFWRKLIGLFSKKAIDSGTSELSVRHGSSGNPDTTDAKKVDQD